MKNMKKKIIFLAIIVLFSLLTTLSYATNEMKNDIHNTTDKIMDGAGTAGNMVKDGVNSVGGAVENGMRDLGNTITDSAQKTGNAITNGLDNMDDNYGDDYTATRTDTTGVTNADMMSTNLWTWIAIAVAGIIIVGLVWYYATDHNDVNR